MNKAPNIPRYSKEDTEKFAKEIENVVISSDVKFKDIWDRRITYTLVPTEEAQLERWSWGRICLVGDNSTKMTPNMGAGGNAAIETAAALANEIKQMADDAGKGKPSYQTVKKHLKHYQEVRETRIKSISKAANGLTRIHALDTLKDKIFAFWVLPAAGDLFTNLNCDMAIGSVVLNYLPIPERSKLGTMPFNPSQGLGRYESKLLRAAKALPFLGLSVLAGYFMFGTAAPPMMDYVDEVFKKGIRTFSGEGLYKPVERFYGVKAIDDFLKPITAVFASTQFGDEIGNWQTFQFLQDAGVLYAIMLLESARRANLMTLLQTPLIFGLLMQFAGIGIFMPFYLFVHYVLSPIENFRARDLRLTSMVWTASILPVLLLTLYIPHYGSYLTSFGGAETRNKWVWIQLLFPIFASVSQYLLKKTGIVADTVAVDRIHHPNRDLPTVGFTLLSLSALTAASWLYTLVNSPFSMTTIFMPNIAEAKTGADFSRLFLQFDHTSMITSAFLWLLYLFGDMKRSGFLKDSWFSVLIRGVMSFVLLGPGATIGLGFLWRENVLASKWHNEAIIPEAWK